MKRSLFPIVIILSMFFSLSGSFRPVQAGYASPSPDLDQDGISSDMEADGWYNLAGGPFKTNPNKADSDQDGLTDAEEKLFNTNPNDPASPGISVKYDSAFKTLEYFNTKDPAYLTMVQGGNQYLLTQGLVVRRGTTFKIAAVNSGTAALTISGDGMTPITPVRDPARGGWKVTLPADGTVGTYTATITGGGLAAPKSLPIYVIFQLPTDLTQAQIDAFLYDDDPANKRDEVAVYFRAKDYKYWFDGSDNPEVPPDPSTCQSTTPGICSLDMYHLNFGYAQAFWTEQFTKNVLINFALPAIQGKATQYAATQAVADKADQSVRVNYLSAKNSFSSATKWYPSTDPSYPNMVRMDGGACETNAGVFTSMLRSVGIASRPFNHDYNKTPGHGEDGNYSFYEYDHAVMMWMQAPGVATNRWYADRTSIAAEDEYKLTPDWTGGTSGVRLLADVAKVIPTPFGNFRDAKSDLVQSANEGWDFQIGSLGGGMVNTVWTSTGVPDEEFDNPAAPDHFLNRDYKWDSKHPLEMDYQSPYLDLFNCQLWQGDGWTPGEWYDQNDPHYYSNPLGRNALGTYLLPIGVPGSSDPLENWPYNPNPKACSPSSVGSADCTAFLANWKASCTPLPGQTLGSSQPQDFQTVPSKSPALNSSVQLGNIHGDRGVDQDGDGRLDKLVVEFEVTSAQAGEYQVGGWLSAGEKAIRADVSKVSLTPGQQTLQVSFDGQAIGDNQVDGPYQVKALWVAPADQAVSEAASPEEMAAYQTYQHPTQAYQASVFIVRAAYIADNFTYTVTGKNANGLVDAITVSVPLQIAIPDMLKLDGDLYDANGEFVGHAEWTGSSPVAELEFKIEKTQPPYSLEHLNLIDLKGKALDARYAPVYKIEDLTGQVDMGNISLGEKPASIAVQAVTPTNTFTVTPVDLNGNGRYDRLTIAATVNVSGQGGSYWIEGMLVDERGLPVAWSVSSPQTLPVGDNQKLQMLFDGRQLYDRLPLTTSQKFTLVGVKIFSGSPDKAVLEADVPVTNFSTPAYLRSKFEPSSLTTPFEDDLESGESKWAKTGSWTLVTSTWNSGSHAYRATGNGTLTMAAGVNFSKFNSLGLRFSYALDPGDNVKVDLQISTNGSTWTTLQSYTELTDYWTTQLVDLSAYQGASAAKIRFNVTGSSGNPALYVDDISISVGPRALYMPVIVR